MKINIEAISGCEPCPLRQDCSFGKHALYTNDGKPDPAKRKIFVEYVAATKEINPNCPRSEIIFPPSPQ